MLDVNFWILTNILSGLWVKSWKMNKNQKRYFHNGSSISKDQIFELLDTVQSDNNDDIDILLNDSDTEFIASEEVQLNWQSRQ